MLTIIVSGDELFDDEKQEFITSHEDVILELEHSLISLSKWESITEKPFITSEDKTSEDTLLYIKCMVVTPNFPPEVFSRLSKENIEQINNYIDAKMTATWFREVRSSARSQEAITSELIYYWLTVFHIPFEVQNWHLNRLFTLIRICNVKNSSEKKMSRSESARTQRQLNAERKARLGTTG